MERKKKYRANLLKSENKEKYDDYKKKAVERTRAYREEKKKDEESAKVFRKRQAEADKKYREKKARCETLQSTSEDPSVSFKSPNALGKAVRKVESVLPKTALKTRDVLQELYNRHQFIPEN